MLPFCSAPLWEHDKVWNTTDPVVGECFRDTVLVFIPCAFLWTLLPVMLPRYRSMKVLTATWSGLAIAKMVLVVLLALICSWRLFYYAYLAATYSDAPGVSISSFVAETVKILTFALSAVLINMERQRKVTSSGYQFVFWLLLLLCAFVEFYSHLRDALQGEYGIYDRFIFASVMAYYPVVALVFCLFCCLDEDAEAKKLRKLSWPEYRSSVLSRILFSWFSGLVYKGWRRPLRQSDLWTLDSPDMTKTTVTKFEIHWKAELNRGRSETYQPSILKALAKTYWKLMLITGFLQLISTVLLQTVALPYALRYIIWFVSAPVVETWKGYFVAVALVLISVGFSISLAQFYHFGAIISLRMRSALTGCIYRKALRISASAKRNKTAADTVTLVSVDAQRFTLSPVHFHSLWGCLLQIIIAVILLYEIIGPSVFAGIGAMFLTIPTVGVVMRKIRGFEAVQLEEKDARISIMSEILNGIKIIKLYAWEENFEKKVDAVRNREIVAIRKSAHLKAINMITWLFTPSLIALVSFTCFVLSDDNNILTPTTAFVSLALFGILRLPLALLPAAITGIIQSALSLRRISTFLLSDETDPENVSHLSEEDPSQSFAVSVKNATFSWSNKDDAEPVLRNIDLDILPGTLVAVVGSVGAGKSSLCSALLGSLEKTSGTVLLRGRVAYCSQSAWIQNRTVKENILFGRPYDERLYDDVISATALRPDLEILPAGDETEIGEKGINLSGGQKQRIVILDDPLSSVDAHVAKHIFDEVIGPDGLLRNKTRILVTHHANFLPLCDRVVFLQNGEISAFAPLTNLLHQSDFSQFHEVLKIQHEDQKITKDPTAGFPFVPEKLAQIDIPDENTEDLDLGDTTVSYSKNGGNKVETPEDSTKEEKSKLIQQERTGTGKVRWEIYRTLLRYASLWATFVTVFAHAIYTAFVLAANIWLSMWSEENLKMLNGTGANGSVVVDTAQRDYRLGVYAVLNLLQAVFIYISALVLALSCIRASRRLHFEMLRRLLRAPLSFFEATPVGRILNRFSRDLDTLDTQLPTHFKMWINGLFILITVAILICISTPLFALVVPVVGIIYYLIQRAFVPSSRQIKRIEAVTRSPILSHFQETISGRQTILAMNQEERFVEINDRLCDVHNMSSYANAVGQRWILVRVETLGAICTFFAALFAVIGKERWDTHPGLLGLAITYATSMTSSFNWLVRTSSDIEANAVSVERMHEYTQIKQEAEWHKETKRPTANWPETGQVEFHKYSLRYRPDLPLVLRDVDCVIAGGEKVGVCGRTGAGKTSLISALFRLIEPSSGFIRIDGLDITELGLHDVRSRLTIIPQDPVLFNGTLRRNLDPFDTHTDAEIWNTLEVSHLRDFVQNRDAKLEMEVVESGDNLSVGQRQLVCLARAVLRKSRILILDEATASIDYECDELIQLAIRKEFADCTVITVAHRLSTIMDYDRVMVLENGVVVEFDSPRNLLSNSDSHFYDLARSAGLAPS